MNGSKSKEKAAEVVPATVPEILSTVTPTPAAYLRAMRKLEKMAWPLGTPVKFAIVSTFTVELLRPYLVVEAARRGLRLDVHFAPYNQLEQQLLDLASPLYAFQPDVVLIAARLEDLSPALTSRFLKLSSTEIDREMENVTGRISALIGGIRRCSRAAVLLFNFALPAHVSAGLADAAIQRSQASVVHDLNEQLASACRGTIDAHIFDYAGAVENFGRQRWQDPKLFFMGRIPFGLEAQIELARQLTRYLRALVCPACKCLVVDLDNTLWGGVLGEEGIGGIALGEDFPGNIYKDFQRTLLALRDRGVLLAIASKNNEADVKELFEKHADCVLRLNDFADCRINWEDKPSNLKAIAAELNIGTDALAFFDDNPVERELVRTQMPEVKVIDVPQNPLEYSRAVLESDVFDRLTLSDEDRQRHAIYSEQRQRQELQASCTSPEQFLRQLETKATIGYVGPDTLERVAQLLAKTNQFNLTTRRHSAAKVQELIASGAVALWMRVADRFGNNGLVGAAIAVPEKERRWFVDTFLLSCRVIGRRVETALLASLIDQVRKHGGKEIFGDYIPTTKNSPAADFYAKHGFQRVAENQWQLALDVQRQGIVVPDCVTVTLGA